MKVLFVVTHLLGTGHLSRVMTLARAFHAAGHDAVVVSGGMPAPHLDDAAVKLHQLPPLRSDGVDFTRLLDENGVVAGPEHMAARLSQLLDILAAEVPDALITELFPFGRRSLRDEFSALLQSATTGNQRPRIFASIRDILAPPSKPKKAAFAREMIQTYYDGVLVHADPEITPLSLSWPVDPDLETRLHYTGFVAPAAAPADPDGGGQDEVIVTAGGGDVGDTLFQAALDAAKQDAPRVWRLLVGGKTAEARIKALSQDAPPNAVVEGLRPDFRQMLYHAAASVSMCGYNTAQDLLQTSCPAVFVPFDAGQEVEQRIRAEALGKLPGIDLVLSEELTGEALLQTVKAASAEDRRAPRPAPMGAAKTVEIVSEIVQVAA